MYLLQQAVLVARLIFIHMFVLKDFPNIIIVINVSIYIVCEPGPNDDERLSFNKPQTSKVEDKYPFRISFIDNYPATPTPLFWTPNLQ